MRATDEPSTLPTRGLAGTATSSTTRARDLARLAEIRRALAEGLPADEATWRGLSHPSFGLTRYKGPDAVRPTPATLARKFAALCVRVEPSLAAEARAQAVEGLAALAGKAVATVAAVQAGEFGDVEVLDGKERKRVPAGAQDGRVRLEAAKFALAAVGVAERSGGTSSVAVQVNVSAADALRSIRARERAGVVLDAQPADEDEGGAGE